MTTQHTPGPWTVDIGTGYCGEGNNIRPMAKAVKAKNKTVCAVLSKWRQKDEQCDADARLISAAPDLLAALEDIIKNHGGGALGNRLENSARAAIAKAKGQQ